MLTLQDVLAARERIRGLVGVTPCPLSEPFSELCGARIHFKLENVHRTGSFKERGAANKFSLLAPEEHTRELQAHSAHVCPLPVDKQDQQPTRHRNNMKP